jgi:hypothetical protein
MRCGGALGLALVVLGLLGCGGSSNEVRAVGRKAEPEQLPPPAKGPSTTKASVVFAPPPPSPPPLVAFDPATATTLRAEIVAIPQRKRWVACGEVHSIGALEVEVLDVGEPRPKMVLLVSCPVDLGLGRALQGQRLEVGATIIVSLHAKKQAWPHVGGLPEGVPQRQVSAFLAAPL